MTYKTSVEGVKRIRVREGCKLKAYKDTVGVWTIGVGHTGRTTGNIVKKGMVITQAQADAFLVADLAPVEKVVNAALKVPVHQNEFDALVSLGFNVGAGHIPESTIVHKLNAGDFEGATKAFLMWDKPKEIIGRRKTEMEQFATLYEVESPHATVLPVAAMKIAEPPPPLNVTLSGWKTYIGLAGVIASNVWRASTHDESIPTAIEAITAALAAGGFRHAVTTHIGPLLAVAKDPQALTKSIVSGAISGLRA